MTSDYARTKAWRLKNPGARAEEARRYRAKHPEKVAAIQARYREQNIEKIRAEGAAAARARRAQDPEAARRRSQEWAARRDAKRIVEMGRPKPAACELCRKTGADCHGDRIVFDHDHRTGRARGWLCDRCNKVLGHVKDDAGLLRQMARYLETNNGRTDHKESEGTPCE